MNERARLLLARLYDQDAAPSQAQWDAWRAEMSPMVAPPPPPWPYDCAPIVDPRGREEWPGGWTCGEPHHNDTDRF